MGFKRSGRACAEPGCGGKLADCVLDWGDALPEGELRASERAADAAGLALCLGTSLQIAPACNLPLRTLRKGAAFRLSGSKDVKQLSNGSEEPSEGGTCTRSQSAAAQVVKVVHSCYPAHTRHAHNVLGASSQSLAVPYGSPEQTPLILMHAGAGGKLVIVNLQKTPKDRRAALVIRARADRVMRSVMGALGMRVRQSVAHSLSTV